MVVFYFFLMFILLSLNNVYVVWLLMEFMFIYFLLISINLDSKSVGLVMYFFFQSLMSLFIFICIFYFMEKMLFFLLIAKLGLFPFFYWMIVVTIKVGLLSNMFILAFQKISVFWMLWLVMGVSLNMVLLLVYLSLFFVMINLLMITDLWLLLVYSSLVNTGLILLSIYGHCYLMNIFLYLFMVILILAMIKFMDSYMELMFIVFLFLVIPPFYLFFFKFYVVLSMEFFSKVMFFLMLFDVLVLMYYFSLVFMKFILMDLGIMIYFMNLFMILIFLVFSNCVTMIVFY